MFPHTPLEEYTMEVYRGDVLRMFAVVRIYIKIFPSIITLELHIDGNMVFQYQHERIYLA